MTVKSAPVSLAFEDSDEPVKHTRETGPNPFATKVKELAADWDESNGRSRKSAHVVVPTADLGKHQRQLREAVGAIGRGVRTKITPVSDTHSTLHFQVATLKVGAGRPKAATDKPATKK